MGWMGSSSTDPICDCFLPEVRLRQSLDRRGRPRDYWYRVWRRNDFSWVEVLQTLVGNLLSDSDRWRSDSALSLCLRSFRLLPSHTAEGSVFVAGDPGRR